MEIDAIALGKGLGEEVALVLHEDIPPFGDAPVELSAQHDLELTVGAIVGHSLTERHAEANHGVEIGDIPLMVADAEEGGGEVPQEFGIGHGKVGRIVAAKDAVGDGHHVETDTESQRADNPLTD